MNLEKELDEVFKQACKITSILISMIVRRKFSLTRMEEVAAIMKNSEEQMVKIIKSKKLG